MQLRTLLDWLFCFGTRARCALVLYRAGECGAAATTIVVLVSVVGSATVMASTTFSAASVNLDTLTSTIQNSVDRVSAGLEVRGSVIARSADGSSVDRIELTMGVFGEGTVPVSDEAGGERLVISYRDDETYIPSLPYLATFIDGDGDSLLERDELATISVDLTGLEPRLHANERFTLEMMAPVGGTVEIGRTLPFILQPVMSLH